VVEVHVVKLFKTQTLHAVFHAVLFTCPSGGLKSIQCYLKHLKPSRVNCRPFGIFKVSLVKFLYKVCIKSSCQLEQVRCFCSCVLWWILCIVPNFGYCWLRSSIIILVYVICEDSKELGELKILFKCIKLGLFKWINCSVFKTDFWLLLKGGALMRVTEVRRQMIDCVAPNYCKKVKSLSRHQLNHCRSIDISAVSCFAEPPSLPSDLRIVFSKTE
jgi:hypothetical protein